MRRRGWESAEHVPVTLIAVIKAMADGKDPRQVIREWVAAEKAALAPDPEPRKHDPTRKKPMRTPKIIPPLSSKSYSVLHQIERVYEETRAPVPRVAIAAKHSPTGDNVGAWLSRLSKGALIRQSDCGGYVPAWADTKSTLLLARRNRSR